MSWAKTAAARPGRVALSGRLFAVAGWSVQGGGIQGKASTGRNARLRKGLPMRCRPALDSDTLTAFLDTSAG